MHSPHDPVFDARPLPDPVFTADGCPTLFAARRLPDPAFAARRLPDHVFAAQRLPERFPCLYFFAKRLLDNLLIACFAHTAGTESESNPQPAITALSLIANYGSHLLERTCCVHLRAKQ